MTPEEAIAELEKMDHQILHTTRLNGKLVFKKEPSIFAKIAEVIKKLQADNVLAAGIGEQPICKQCKVWPVNIGEDLCDRCCGIIK